MCVWACHETVNRFTEPTEPGCRGNLAKKRGREVPETGRDRYKAEEEVGVVEVVVLSCSVNREKGKGSKKHWKSRLLPHIEVVESRGLLGRCQHQSQMCSARVCVCETGLMCMRACESLESGDAVYVSKLMRRHSLYKKHTLACRDQSWTLVSLFLAVKPGWWLNCC